MFQQAWANAVQLISLPLEILGLLLAWTEVMRPVRAQRITEVLLALGRIRFPAEGIGSVGRLAWRLFIAIELALMAIAWLLVFSFVENLVPARTPLRVLSVLGLAIGPIVGSILLFRSVAWSLTRLDVVSNGRPLGAFGLLLAAVGTAGEVYQVAVLVYSG